MKNLQKVFFEFREVELGYIFLENFFYFNLGEFPTIFLFLI